jgi:ribonuclease T1
VLVGLVVLLLAVLGLSLISATSDESSQPGRTDVTAATIAGIAEPTGTDPASGLQWIAADDLPAEARETLALIESDGPFPYDRDGAVFQNREAILPDESRG